MSVWWQRKGLMIYQTHDGFFLECKDGISWTKYELCQSQEISAWILISAWVENFSPNSEKADFQVQAVCLFEPGMIREHSSYEYRHYNTTSVRAINIRSYIGMASLIGNHHHHWFPLRCVTISNQFDNRRLNKHVLFEHDCSIILGHQPSERLELLLSMMHSILASNLPVQNHFLLIR